jgi:ribose 5-phosphate isomerase B
MNTSKEKLFIATDHAGRTLKDFLVNELTGKGYEIVDLTPKEEDPEDDYPEIMAQVAIQIAETEGQRGIILGGSGQGEAIAANRFPGVRAVVYYGGNEEIVKLSREHNDANILSLGARFLSENEALSAVSLWLATPFSGEERHERRIAKLDSFM